MDIASPPAEPGLRSLRRTRTHAKIAGLCAALGKRWNVDPVLLRVGFVLLTLSAGLGAIIYLAGWLLIPVEGKSSAPIDDLLGDGVRRRWPKQVWIAILVIICLALSGAFGSFSPFSFGPAVVIAAIWYFGFYKPQVSAAPPPPSAPVVGPAASHSAAPTPFTEAAHAWRQRIAEHQGQAPAAAADLREWPQPPAANLGQAERSAYLAMPDPVGLYVEPGPGPAMPALVRRPAAGRLRWLTISAAVLAMGVLALVDVNGVNVPLVGYAALASAVFGIGLVLATWLGRARGLLALGLAVGIATAGLTAVQLGAWPADLAQLEFWR